MEAPVEQLLDKRPMETPINHKGVKLLQSLAQRIAEKKLKGEETSTGRNPVGNDCCASILLLSNSIYPDLGDERTCTGRMAELS